MGRKYGGAVAFGSWPKVRGVSGGQEDGGETIGEVLIPSEKNETQAKSRKKNYSESTYIMGGKEMGGMA